MLYLHDVWVNWFEAEENGYNVCSYHEWRKEDKIELLDQVPLLYIKESLYNYIENDMQDLPEDLLHRIKKRAYGRKGQIRVPLDYATVVTDGKNILALDTGGYKIPIKKSRLIPRQELIVYNMIKNRNKRTFKFNSKNYTKKHHILSMAPELIFGLTRRERQLKQLLMMALDQLRIKNNLEELRYWLTEWNPKKYPFIRFMNEKQVWRALYSGVKIGWSDDHESFGKKLIKGEPFLEQMWHFEKIDEQNTTKLI